MKKVTTLVLMLCLVLSGALCYAGGEACIRLIQNYTGPVTLNERIKTANNKDETDIVLIENKV